MGKDKYIPIIAIFVLILASLSTIYVYTTTADSEYIKINEVEYTIEQLFFISKERSYETFSGIALDDLLKKVGIPEPENHEYTLVASDGYQKTVKWENMKSGLLTKEGQSIFSDLPKAFRVKDIVKIEVK